MSPIALEQEDHARDAAFNKAMHGKSAKAKAGMTAMLQKDRAAQQAAVDEYFKHWDNKAAAEETEETRKVRPHPLNLTAGPVILTLAIRRDETSMLLSPGSTFPTHSHLSQVQFVTPHVQLLQSRHRPVRVWLGPELPLLPLRI